MQTKPEYAEFKLALEAGCEKIREYYEKTAESHMYTLALCEYQLSLCTSYTSIELLCTCST